MQVVIKRIDKTLPLPEYHTAGSVAFDLYSRIDAVVEKKTTMLLPTNFIFATPPGYMLSIVPRSSLFRKKGLKMPNSVGVIDQDYCGETDECSLYVENTTDQDVEVKRGERLCQGIFIKIDKAEWQEVDKMSDKSRGGFGSTGL